jgi:hypothetical protein
MRNLDASRSVKYLTFSTTTLVFGLCLLLGDARSARAQEPIKDNSFLIEEAYNQGRGVVQHINAFSRARGGDWIFTFTQEWPAPAQRHQLSFSLPVARIQGESDSHTGLGDLALNYRYQAIGMAEGPLAFSPRLTYLAPTGKYKHGLGAGGGALQVNLPLSYEVSPRVDIHTNVGMTRTFKARSVTGDKADTNTFALGQSIVWLAAPRVNFLLEAVWSRAQGVSGPNRTDTSDSFYINPGVRWSHDFENGLQIVPGLAFPIGVGPSRGDRAFFLYLSFEHPFRKAQ